MAQYNNHLSFSVLVAAGYAALGLVFLDMNPEQVALACAIVVIAGMLPDIDAPGAVPVRELAGLLAAVVPIAMMTYFPELGSGGITRMALLIIASYVLTRIIVIKGLGMLTVHRGMIHSIPAAIIVFEGAFLLFDDLYWADRLYVSGSAFVGFFSHLLLDSFSNIDLVGRVMGGRQESRGAMKLFGYSFGSTFIMYSCVLGLGYCVWQDLEPDLPALEAGVKQVGSSVAQQASK